MAAGAAGVVLDGALLLARETPLEPSWRERIARWDGSETLVVAPERAAKVFGYSPCPTRLRWLHCDGRRRKGALPGSLPFATKSVGRTGQCLPVGQDSALAAGLARKYVTVGGIVQATSRAIAEGIAAARATRPLAESSSLARALGTRFPVLQGPMTRVSDVSGFAEAVARGGGCRSWRWLCCAKPRSARSCGNQPASSRGARGALASWVSFHRSCAPNNWPWSGNFVPHFAIFAGGRPDQAAGLERDGIVTYLHVPSPGLLDRYLRDGSRRFVLEGRECGGHVGPRSSFILWEQAVTVVSDALDRGIAAHEVTLVFAGGIHDARSAALFRHSRARSPPAA